MEIKVVISCICLILAAVRGTQVHLSSEWKTNLGWEVTCYWQLYANDSLQSVRLYNNEQQFLIYRPETDGEKRSAVFGRPEDVMTVNCAQAADRGVNGTCRLSMEFFQPQKNGVTFSCEVSGERPHFRMEKKSIFVDAFVHPTNAVVEVVSEHAQSGRVALNCTSSGVPAPSLVWTVGEQKIPHEFTGNYWNATSKLWHVWSVVSYTPLNERIAVCTPEVIQGSQMLKGDPAIYNSANHIKETTSIMFAVILSFLLR